MLGLKAEEADEAAVRRARRTLSLATHPDKIGEAPGAATAFNLVTEVGRGWRAGGEWRVGRSGVGRGGGGGGGMNEWAGKPSWWAERGVWTHPIFELFALC